MGLDREWPAFSQRAHRYLGLVILPVHYVVDMPSLLFQRFYTHGREQSQWIEENAKLRGDVVLLQAKLHELFALKEEQHVLSDVMKKQDIAAIHKLTVARLLGVNITPFHQEMMMNKGSYHGVYVGQPVMDGYGIMGQVVKVGVLTSHILLVTDTRSAIPLQIRRNGLRAIAVGMGTNRMLELLHIPDTWDVQPGDELVSSGLGRRYPAGYPVGYVHSVQRQGDAHFAKILVTPKAHLQRGHRVLLIWPDNKGRATSDAL